MCSWRDGSAQTMKERAVPTGWQRTLAVDGRPSPALLRTAGPARLAGPGRGAGVTRSHGSKLMTV